MDLNGYKKWQTKPKLFTVMKNTTQFYFKKIRKTSNSDTLEQQFPGKQKVMSSYAFKEECSTTRSNYY